MHHALARSLDLISRISQRNYTFIFNSFNFLLHEIFELSDDLLSAPYHMPFASERAVRRHFIRKIALFRSEFRMKIEIVIFISLILRLVAGGVATPQARHIHTSINKRKMHRPKCHLDGWATDDHIQCYCWSECIPFARVCAASPPNTHYYAEKERERDANLIACQQIKCLKPQLIDATESQTEENILSAKNSEWRTCEHKALSPTPSPSSSPFPFVYLICVVRLIHALQVSPSWHIRDNCDELSLLTKPESRKCCDFSIWRCRRCALQRYCTTSRSQQMCWINLAIYSKWHWSVIACCAMRDHLQTQAMLHR